MQRRFHGRYAKARILPAAGFVAVYIALSIAAFLLIGADRQALRAMSDDIVPSMSSVHGRYVSTMSALAMHTAVFAGESHRHAELSYLALRQSAEDLRRLVAENASIAPELAARAKDLVREIALAEPVIAQIGANPISASQGFSALSGLESEIVALTGEFEALQREQLGAIAEHESAFRLKVLGLVIAAVLFSGLVMATLWRRSARLERHVAGLAARSDALREEKRRAEAECEAKSRFLATMSHEMRTPMNGVIGMSQLLLREPLGQKERQFAGKIYESAAALVEMINEVLDMSAIEAGTVRIVPRAFSLDELLRSARAPFEALAHQKGLAFVTSVAPDIGDRFHGDDLRVRQILQNLLGNAVKFTSRGSIRLAVVEAGPGLLRFEVADTGIGIPADEVELIFERFHQIDNAETRAIGGTGLGLAISRELAGMLGGTIEVASEPGSGSTFSVTLPLPALSEGTARPLRETA